MHDKIGNEAGYVVGLSEGKEARADLPQVNLPVRRPQNKAVGTERRDPLIEERATKEKNEVRGVSTRWLERACRNFP